MAGLQAASTLVVLMAALAAAVWVGLYLFVRSRRMAYESGARRIRHILAAMDADLTRYENAARPYATTAPEPYGPLAERLHAAISRARASQRAGEALFHQLERGKPATSASALRTIVATVWPLPREWHSLALQADLAARDVEAAYAQLDRIAALIEQARQAPLDVARRVRGLSGAADRINRIGHEMQQAGVRGNSLNGILAETGAHVAALQSLPAIFLQASDDGVLKHATQDVTVQAYDRLKAIERPIYDSLRRLQNWQLQVAEAKNMVGVMQLELSTAERIMRETPAQVDVLDHAIELQQLKQVAQVIEARQNAPDVDTLSDLSNAATQQAMKAKELATHLMSLHKTYQSVEQAIGANNQVLARIRATMDKLERDQVCPVAWGASAALRDRLLDAQAQLSTADTQRNANRLKSDLDKALDIGMQAQALETRASQAREAHTQLVALMAAPEMQSQSEWLQETASLHLATIQYAVENWPASDAVVNLRADTAAVVKREQALAPALNGQPLPEDQLQQWVSAARVYISDRQALDARLSRIRERLNEIAKQDQAASALLAETANALEALRVETGQLPPDARIVVRWNELVEVWQRGSRLSEQVQRRDLGKVADKAVAVEVWARQCQNAVAALHAEVEAEVIRVRNQLRASLEAVQAVAPFDLENAVRGAQVQIAASPVKADGGRNPAAHRIAYWVEQTNLVWQELDDASDALAELEAQVVDRLAGRLERIEAARQQAGERIEELDKLRQHIPDIAGLPIACGEADQLEQDYQQAEAGLADVARSGRTVKTVVQRLDSLIPRYEYITSHGATVTSDVENDLLRLQDAWSRLNTWSKQLKRYRDQHRRDAALFEALNERLAEVGRRFDDINRRNKGRPLPLNYAGQELDSAYRGAYRDVEIERGDRLEMISTRTIETMD